jgi:hypothetical protein
MARPISLLLIPTGAEDDAPPEIYLDAGGVWRTLGEMSLLPQKLPQARASFGKVLGELSEVLDANPANADDNSIRAEGTDLFQKLVPSEIQQVLRKALDQSAGADAPVLRVHAVQRYDWIPWELLYDDDRQHFLGLRFAIARMPIVPNPPEMPDGQPRKISAIANFLGANVYPPGDPLLNTWHDTFTGLTNGAVVNIRPNMAGANWPRIPAVGESLKADVLHITCHGMRLGGEFFLNLAPNDPIPAMKGLGPKQINAFLRTSNRPLVFGNACNPPGGLPDKPRLEPSGLGKAFFTKGALNIVSTLSPVSSRMALDFARKFYETLFAADQPSIGQAMLRTKQHFEQLGAAGANDPTYLFYSLYGPPETSFTH